MRRARNMYIKNAIQMKHAPHVAYLVRRILRLNNFFFRIFVRSGTQTHFQPSNSSLSLTAHTR